MNFKEDFTIIFSKRVFASQEILQRIVQINLHSRVIFCLSDIKFGHSCRLSHFHSLLPLFTFLNVNSRAILLYLAISFPFFNSIFMCKLSSFDKFNYFNLILLLFLSLFSYWSKIEVWIKIRLPDLLLASKWIQLLDPFLAAS